MRASILSLASFRLRREGAVAVVHRNWSQQELAELYRVRDRLVQSGLRVALDLGLTDEGEPWAVFLQSDSGDAFVHIARLNDEVVVANMMANVVYRGQDFRAITDQMLCDAPLVMPRGKTESKIVMHPRSVFTAFVAAAVVLSEFVRSIEPSKAATEQEKTAQDKAVAETKAMFPVIFDRVLARDAGWTSAIGSHSAAAGLMAAAVGAVLIADDHKDDVAPIANLVQERTAAETDATASTDSAGARADRDSPDAEPIEQPVQPALQIPETKFAAAAPQVHGDEEHSAAIETPVMLEAKPLAEPPARTAVLPPELANMASLAKSAIATAPEPVATETPVAGAHVQSTPSSDAKGGKEMAQIMDSIIVARLPEGASERLITQTLDRVIDGGAPAAESQKGPHGSDPVQTTPADPSEGRSWVLHTTATELEPAVMRDGNHDVVLLSGDHLTIYNFRFSEDYLLFEGEIDSTTWIKSIEVKGDDVTIVATNGTIVSLIDSHGLIA